MQQNGGNNGGRKSGGLELISSAIDNATPAPRVGRPVGGSLEEPEFPLLPAGCPVVPLGKLEQVCFYLDELRQLIALDPQKHAKQHIRNLFGRRSDLCDEYWPRVDQIGQPQGARPMAPRDRGRRAAAGLRPCRDL
jgi:hypothetical protein